MLDKLLIKPTIKINNEIISEVETAKTLGINFDRNLRWSKQFTGLLPSSYYKLKHMQKFKNILPINLKLKICDALILSPYNYCAGLFVGAEQSLKNRIQKLQNACLRFSYGLKRRQHITEYLQRSGWKDMDTRRKHQLRKLVQKIKHNKQPEYLYNKLRQLMSNHKHFTPHKNDLRIPKHNSTTYKKSFTYLSSNLWNLTRDGNELTNKGPIIKPLDNLQINM